LREVWKHEALDFTAWLEQNVDVLNDVLDIRLGSVVREQSAGTFSVDLVAEDEAGNPVIIENQLERSNHDHLGKVITYLTALEARTAIWIVSDPRPEHTRAVGWLNEHPGASFYLLKVEAIRIGDSPAAPLLTLIVGPTAETREVGATKQEMTERHRLRKVFWTGLLEKANVKTRLHSAISPSKYHYVSAGSGKSGVVFSYVVQKDRSQIELYIDRGQDAEQDNLAIFDALESQRDEIEGEFGGPLTWERLEGKRACRIAKLFSLGGWGDDQEGWEEIQDAMTDAMAHFERALKPRIARLPL